MSKINRVPIGLQGLLGNTAAGSNPDILLNEVRPTISLEPFWDFERTVFQEEDRAVSAPQNGSFYTVPIGELWLPIAIGGTLGGMGTGETASLSVKIWDSVAINPIALAATDLRVFKTSLEFLSVGYSWPRRQVFRGGQLISVICDDLNTAAAKTLQSALQYVRLSA